MPKEAKIVQGVQLHNLHEVFLDQFLMHILEILLIFNQFQYDNEDYSIPPPPKKNSCSMSAIIREIRFFRSNLCLSSWSVKNNLGVVW